MTVHTLLGLRVPHWHEVIIQGHEHPALVVVITAEQYCHDLSLFCMSCLISDKSYVVCCLFLV